VVVGGASFADDRMRVVTTLSTYADIANAIGGTRVSSEAIASPRFNPHFIEPRPSDVLRLKRADLFIHSGLDLEAWRGPLVDAAGSPGIRPGGARELDLSAGVQLLDIPTAPVTRAMGDIHLHGNPHYWLSPENGVIIARRIGEKLAAIDPASAEVYRRNTAAYIGRLEAAIQRWRALVAPLKGRPLVAYHDEWVYLTTFMGLTLERFLEPKPGIPPSPHQIEAIEG
jgi:zinc/manganese transport system substrate-binding protein